MADDLSPELVRGQGWIGEAGYLAVQVECFKKPGRRIQRSGLRNRAPCGAGLRTCRPQMTKPAELTRGGFMEFWGKLSC